MEKLELVHCWRECTTDCVAAVKNNMVMFATTWMDLAIVILSEVSQTKKDKYRMISFFPPLAVLDLRCSKGFLFFLVAASGVRGLLIAGASRFGARALGHVGSVAVIPRP